MRKERILSLLLVFVMVISMLAACGTKDTGSSTETSESQSSMAESSEESSVAESESDYKVYDETVEVSLLLPATTSMDGINAVIEACEERFHIKVLLETRVAGDEGETLVRTRLASGDMADICWFNAGALFATLNPSENFVDITNEDFTQTLLDEYKETVTIDGVVYGVPGSAANVDGILYNIPIFEENGYEVPTTWDKLLELCEQMQADGITPVGGTFGDSWTSQMILLGGYYELQAQVPDFAEGFTNHTKTYSNTPEALRIFEKLSELLPYTAEDYLAAKYTDGQLAIAEGEYAMWPMWTSAINQIGNVLPEKVNDVGFFAIPADEEENNGICMWAPDSLYINKNIDEEKQEAVKQFLKFMISEEGLAIYAEKQKPQGPYMVKGVEMPDDVYQGVKDAKEYIDEGKYCLALEFLTPVKGPNSPQICTEAYSGVKTPEECARAYDEDCEKQAQQLGLEGW